MTDQTNETTDRVELIAARAAIATPGPWDYGGRVNKDGDWLYRKDDKYNPIADFEFTDVGDADFIAHAREDIPWLIDALAKAERELAANKTQLGPARIVETPPSMDTNKRYWEVYCPSCTTHECSLDQNDPRLTQRRDQHNRDHSERPLAYPSDPESLHIQGLEQKLAQSERDLDSALYERDMSRRGKTDAYAQLYAAEQKLAEQAVIRNATLEEAAVIAENAVCLLEECTNLACVKARKIAIAIRAKKKENNCE